MELVTESGLSSWTLCQNIFSCKEVHEQGLAVALALSENILKGQGAWRVHGGGFAGTIQAFVPDQIVDDYIGKLESVFGVGACHRLLIRPVGSVCLGDLIG